METMAEAFQQRRQMLREYFRGIFITRIPLNLCDISNLNGLNSCEMNKSSPPVPVLNNCTNEKEYKSAWKHIWSHLQHIQVEDPVPPTKKRTLTETFQLDNGNTISVSHAKTLNCETEERQIRIVHDATKEGPSDIQVTVCENKVAKCNTAIWAFNPPAEADFCSRKPLNDWDCAEIFSDPDMYWKNLRTLLNNGRIKSYTIKDRQEGHREVVTRFYNSYGRVEEYRKFFQRNDPDYDDAIKVTNEIPV